MATLYCNKARGCGQKYDNVILKHKPEELIGATKDLTPVWGLERQGMIWQ